MKQKKQKIVIALVSAAITFATLMATIGTKHFHYFKHCITEQKSK